MAKKKDKLRKLLAEFYHLEIPTDNPGFLDHPNFLAREKDDPAFLENYARFVNWRDYDDEYLARAKRIIEIAANELHAGLLREKRLGACIDTSMTLGRILDLHGVWNYVVRGALKIAFPEDSGFDPFWFWPFEVPDGSGKEYGHKWLYAPPFLVIDVTIKLQEYDQPFVDYLPETVFVTEAKQTRGKLEDLVSPAYLGAAVAQGFDESEGLDGVWPYYGTDLAPDFPAHLFDYEQVTLKYIPTGVGSSDEPLEKIRTFKVDGKFAFEYYQDAIKPKLDAVDAVT